MKRLASVVTLVAVMCGATLLSACATYGEKVAPIPVPSTQAGAVEVDGASLVARAYVDPKAARQAFGFDIRGAGLLPVQFVVDNQSGKNLAIQPGQTLLLDGQGNAWPLLSASKAAERVRSTVGQGEAIKSGAKSSLLTGLAGAVAGAAIGIVTGKSVGETAGKGAAAGAAIGGIAGGASAYQDVGRNIQSDLEDKSIQDRLVKPGELAYGFLFFPGANEAESAQSVRLALRIGDTSHIVKVPVTVVSPATQ